MLEIKLGILKSGLCGLHRSADSGDARDFWLGVMLYDYPDPGRCRKENDEISSLYGSVFFIFPDIRFFEQILAASVLNREELCQLQLFSIKSHLSETG